jgi:hypothetical protein
MVAVGMEQEEAVEGNAALVTRVCSALARGRRREREPSPEARRLR